MSKLGNFCSDNKEYILIGLGAIAGVAGVIWACKKTIDAQDIIEEHNEKLEALNDEIEADDLDNTQLAKVEKRKLYLKTAGKLALNYAGPALTLTGSAVCIGAAFKIIDDDRAMLHSSFLSVLAAYEKYRERVIKRYGVEVDNEIMMGKTVTEVEETDENGNTVKKQKTEFNPIWVPYQYNVLYSNETAPCEYIGHPALDYSHLYEKQLALNERLNKIGWVDAHYVKELLGLSLKVGEGMTDNYIPSNWGIIREDLLPESLKTKENVFGKFNFLPDRRYFEDCAEDAGWGNHKQDTYYDGYMLRFTFYPIDGILQSVSDDYMNA